MNNELSTDILSHLTRQQCWVPTAEKLAELEQTPKTRLNIFLDYIICFMPVVFGCLALAEYLMIPNLNGNISTSSYTYFLCVLIFAAIIFFVCALKIKRAFYLLRHKAPFYSFIFVLLALYDYMTLKTGILVLPYFPWTDQRLADYWISPFMKLLGAIPSPTWIPIVMVIASSLFAGSVFIIALGVWYSLTIATMTGIRNIDRSFYDAAKTLGANRMQLVFNVALPFAVPNVLQGLTQGMSSACMALITAEMVGVESGLGWYVSWQKSWAQYGKMYAAIVVLCIVFIAVNWSLNKIRRRLLRWQEGMVQ